MHLRKKITAIICHSENFKKDNTLPPSKHKCKIFMHTLRTVVKFLKLKRQNVNVLMLYLYSSYVYNLNLHLHLQMT